MATKRAYSFNYNKDLIFLLLATANWDATHTHHTAHHHFIFYRFHFIKLY